jgi:hypothetical protein
MLRPSSTPAPLILLLTAALQGCSQHYQQQCTPPLGSEPLEVAADSLLGQFQLVMIADSGPRAGQVSRGRLILWVGDSSRDTMSGNSLGYRRVLGGTTRVLPREIGVHTLPVPLISRAPHQPGVQGWAPETGASPVRLVLGARRPGGEGIALEFAARDESEWRGWWREEGASGPRAAGHFCLVR